MEPREDVQVLIESITNLTEIVLCNLEMRSEMANYAHKVKKSTMKRIGHFSVGLIGYARDDISFLARPSSKFRRKDEPRIHSCCASRQLRISRNVLPESCLALNLYFVTLIIRA